MADRMTESQLIEAMRDPRYWRPNHPDRTAFIDQVTKGWEDLYPPKEQGNAANGVVHVREHTRRVDGALVHVDAYDRRAVWGNTSQSTPQLKHQTELRITLNRKTGER